MRCPSSAFTVSDAPQPPGQQLGRQLVIPKFSCRREAAP
uniref:Uncharacterized protein n=1 Tax=Tetraselmis sp. GSL018 TaxID=582737 RepID=A0A061R2D4_9CHLO